jgi:hypothetical protein
VQVQPIACYDNVARLTNAVIPVSRATVLGRITTADLTGSTIENITLDSDEQGALPGCIHR